MWRHPKYYKELRKARNELAKRDAVKENREAYSGSSLARNKSDRVISETKPTGDGERAPGQGLSGKLQASSTHPDLLPEHGPEYYAPRRRKRQATSTSKRQATSSKRQASE
jgi:hypothetical protein